MLRYFFLHLIKIIVDLTCKVEVIGSDKILKEGGCIYAGNHLGRLDAFLVYYVIRRKDIILTVAEKYQKKAFYRLAAKSLNAIWIDRFASDFSALRKVLRRLQNGGILAIAPEGTRSKKCSLIEGRLGTVYLGSKSQLPVFPVAIIGTEDDVVKRNLRKFRKSAVKLIVGDPIYFPQIPHENRNEFLETWNTELMCQIAALLPQRYRGFYSNHPRLKELVKLDKITILD
jgi:1-acyl-sn-glycerol-3-phosphate acyltransferase